MDALLTSWISPLGFCIAILVVTLCFIRSFKIMRGSVVIVLFILLFFSFPYISQGLMYTLEKRVPQQPISEIPSADLAILLSGGLKVPRGYRLRPELGQWGDRLAFTFELYSAGKVSKILISGGNDDVSAPGFSESELSKKVLVQWGVAMEDIVVETKSTSTLQNAVFSASFVKDIEPDMIYLISSGFHLPRAHALFCAEGISTIPLPANHLSFGYPDISKANWTPFASGLHNSTIATKEYFAMLYYSLVGKIHMAKLWEPIGC